MKRGGRSLCQLQARELSPTFVVMSGSLPFVREHNVWLSTRSFLERVLP